MIQTLLLLEDEEVLGRVYSRSLREAGFTVTWLKTIKDVQQFMEESSADGIILDQGIKEEERSGMSLIPVLKKKFPKAKIAMLSNYSAFDIGDQAMKAGADAYWVKLNTTPSSLVRNLQELLLEKHRK
ncbi:response regulator [Candidatus Peregrinibacteria bacterium]|nr:response regulator [Candidatus Peregrinibacteria bacterium]